MALSQSLQQKMLREAVTTADSTHEAAAGAYSQS